MKLKVIFGLTVIPFFVAGILLFNLLKKIDFFVDNSTGCIKDNEYAEYFINKDHSDNRTAEIRIKDESTDVIISELSFDGAFTYHYHPIEIHKCHFYAIRSFNYDNTKRKPQPGYQSVIWRSNYKGDGKTILVLQELIGENNIKNLGSNFRITPDGQYANSGYDSDFRVTPDEKYITLIKGVLDNDDYSLIFRNIETGKEEYAINLKDLILSHYPNIHPGSFNMGEWRERYIWVGLSIGAYTTAYMRIERDPWMVKVYASPENDVSGSGGIFNQDNGIIAYSDLTTFTGFTATDREIVDEAKKEGRKHNLFIYNLFTKEMIKIASVEPEYEFWYKPEWVSDTELQYELPDGTRKLYTLK